MSGGTVNGPRARRRGWARALVVLASILAFTAILAVWANRQLLNTDNWTRTSTRLLENPAIRDQVAAYTVDQLYANVDVAAQIRQALPERAQPLAGPAAGALRDLAEKRARRMLSRPRAQALWADANRSAQQQLLKILEGGGPVVSTAGGDVVLNVRALLGEMEQQVGIGGRLAQKIPDSAAQITIMRSDRLAAAQRALKIVRNLPIVLIALSLALFGLALAISPGWRRQALRAYGLGFVLAGAAALLVQDQAGTALVDALTTTAAVEPAATAAWTISTTLLVQAAWATVGYGVFMVLAAWIAGPSRPMVALRRVIAPYASHPAVAYSALAVLFALLLWWAPTPATRDPALALILLVLLAFGTEALRRLIVREHPDADMAEANEGVRRRASAAGDWLRRSTAAGGVAVAGTASRVVTQAKAVTAGGAAEDDRLDRLERLGRLKASGVIDEQEFAAEKQQILAEPANGSDRSTASATGETPQ
jgi:hypothetical protein